MPAGALYMLAKCSRGILGRSGHFRCPSFVCAPNNPQAQEVILINQPGYSGGGKNKLGMEERMSLIERAE